MRLKAFLVLLGLGMMAYGGQKAYVALTNRIPARMSCAQFVAGSNAKWVELTDCQLDLDNAFGLQSRVLKIDKGSFIPVRPAGAPRPAPILLQIKDETQLGALGSPPDRTTVSGLVQFGLDSNTKLRRSLDKVAREKQLGQDYTLIELGGKPSAGDAIVGVAVVVGVPALA